MHPLDHHSMSQDNKFWDDTMTDLELASNEVDVLTYGSSTIDSSDSEPEQLTSYEV